MRVNSFPVEDSVLENKYISWAVRRLHFNSSRGTSGMRLEHLHRWLHKDLREEETDTINWQKVVAIVQAAFCGGTVANESTL